MATPGADNIMDKGLERPRSGSDRREDGTLGKPGPRRGWPHTERQLDTQLQLHTQPHTHTHTHPENNRQPHMHDRYCGIK